MENKLCYSGIGGQALLEGIMMRNRDRYASAVRKQDGTIEVKEEVFPDFQEKHPWAAWPFIRGTVSLILSLIVGMKTLMWSASLVDVSDGEGEEPQTLSDKEMIFTVVIAVVLAVGLFSVLPTVLVNLLRNWLGNGVLLAVVEGVVRLGIFILYVALVGLTPDVKRTFMYHGSEHKCINCLEHGLPLTVENVMKSSKEHRRCGTSFMLIVMVIAIFFFMLIRIDNIWLRILSRILLIPVIAGVSYEVIRLTGSSNSRLAYIISRPGMWMQKLTTKEPTEDMAEVAIAAVERVFDWRAFLKTNYGLEVPGPAEEGGTEPSGE